MKQLVIEIEYRLANLAFWVLSKTAKKLIAVIPVNVTSEEWKKAYDEVGGRMTVILDINIDGFGRQVMGGYVGRHLITHHELQKIQN